MAQLTPEKIAQMETQIAEHRAAERAAAAAAEDAKRTEARTRIETIRIAGLNQDLLDGMNALRDAAFNLVSTDDYNLARSALNAIECFNSFQNILDRRWADVQPAPAQDTLSAL